MSNLSRLLGRASDGWCVRCGRRAESWHHRLPRGRGGVDDGFNCVRVCGDGTRGCHGWIEHHPEEARALHLSIRGSFLRGVYVGPDEAYRAHYNREVWDDDRGWVPMEDDDG